jgi:hypothetical protein
LDEGDAVSAVGLRFGGITTFSCSLSRLAAVQRSSLIVSLPRFVRRVERSEYNTRGEGNAGLFLATKKPASALALDPGSLFYRGACARGIYDKPAKLAS